MLFVHEQKVMVNENQAIHFSGSCFIIYFFTGSGNMYATT